LKNLNVNFVSINNQPNPFFNNVSPEPIPKNLSKLRQTIIINNAEFGVAVDGDADRLGVLDSKGEFVETHDLMPLFFKYLVESRSWDGDIVRTTSMANTIDKVAEENGRKVYEVPVGFKNICRVMLSNDILIGGEESGGFGFKNHIPERDGIFSMLLLIEMLSKSAYSITDLVKELRQKYGPFSYGRIDKHFDQKVLMKNLVHLQKNTPLTIRNFEVESVSLVDGIKFYFRDGSWMLIRISQTEPVGRIYVGSDSDSRVQQLLSAAEEMLSKM
jgi:phosphomannomutase